MSQAPTGFGYLCHLHPCHTPGTSPGGDPGPRGCPVSPKMLAKGRCWAGWPHGDTLSHQPSLARCVGDSQPGRTAGTPRLGTAPVAQGTSGSLRDGVGLGGLRCP